MKTWLLGVAIAVVACLVNASVGVAVASAPTRIIEVTAADAPPLPGAVDLSSAEIDRVLALVDVGAGAVPDVRVVAGTVTEGFVLDVYREEAATRMVMTVVPRSPLSAIDAPLELASSAVRNADGSLDGAATTRDGATGATRHIDAAQAVECTEACLLTGLAGGLVYALACALTTGIYAVVCIAASLVGGVAVDAACSMQSNPYGCYSGAKIVVTPNDIVCDFVSCRIALYLEHTNQTITRSNVGIWWQQVGEPRHFQEWFDLFVPTGGAIQEFRQYAMTANGDPASLVQCTTAVDVSITFNFNVGDFANIWLRTTAHGVPDNGIAKPANPQACNPAGAPEAPA